MNTKHKPAIIFVDWGTSSFRAYLISRTGELLEKIARTSGILNVENGGFAGTLEDHCKDWFETWPKLPVLMCGMIGSAGGWVEVPYLSGNVGPCELAQGVQIVNDTKHDVRIIPGICGTSFDGTPDVMRGEETLLIGALSLGSSDQGLFCLPGTHSKWVLVQDGEIAMFSTLMTGELYALLSSHSILSSMIVSVSADQQSEAFLSGARKALNDTDLLHQLFTIRAEVLIGGAIAETAGEFLSGLLIGTELASMKNQLAACEQPVTLIAGDDLGLRYAQAIDALGRATNIIKSDDACMAGLFAIAREIAKLDNISPAYANFSSAAPGSRG